MNTLTGKERDTETGLDYFGARYMSAAMGRFGSPDPLAITLTRKLDPQGLNLYSYTRNRPMHMIDVDGLATVTVTVNSDRSATVRHYSDGGIRTRSYSGLARGSSGGRNVRNGDTPFGKYRIFKTHKMQQTDRRYGTAKVDMKEISGEVVDFGRCVPSSGMAHFLHSIWPTFVLVFSLIDREGIGPPRRE